MAGLKTSCDGKVGAIGEALDICSGEGACDGGGVFQARASEIA